MGVLPDLLRVAAGVDGAVALVSTPDALSAIHPFDYHIRLLGRTLLYNFAVATIATLILALPVAVVLGKGRGVGGGGAGDDPAGGAAAAFDRLCVRVDASAAAGQRLSHAGQHRGRLPVHLDAGDVALADPRGSDRPVAATMDGDLQQQALLDGAYWRIVGRQSLAAGIGGVCDRDDPGDAGVFGVRADGNQRRRHGSAHRLRDRPGRACATGAIAQREDGAGVIAAAERPAEQRRRGAGDGVPMLCVIAILELYGAGASRGVRTTTDTVDVGPSRACWSRGGLSIALTVLVLARGAGVAVRGDDRCRCIGRSTSGGSGGRFTPPVLGTLTRRRLAAVVADRAGGGGVGEAVSLGRWCSGW